MTLPATLKGFIQPNHIAVNRFTLAPLGLNLIPGGVDLLTFIEISEIERKIEVWETPDRTFVSRGISSPFEFSAIQPIHHTSEYFAMELWHKMSIDPLVIGYALPCTLRAISANGVNSISYAIEGVFPYAKKLPKWDLANEGKMATVEWMFKADDIFPLPI